MDGIDTQIDSWIIKDRWIDYAHRRSMYLLLAGTQLEVELSSLFLLLFRNLFLLPDLPSQQTRLLPLTSDLLLQIADFPLQDGHLANGVMAQHEPKKICPPQKRENNVHR